VLLMMLVVAGMVWLTDWQRGNLRSQEPEIVYGTVLGEGPIVKRDYGLRDTRIFVRLDDGTSRSFPFFLRDMKGCEIGSKVAIEKRGMNLTLARKACPSVEAGGT